MADLKSRADELIDSAIEDARAETFNPSKYTREQAKESHAELTRFVHALCDAAESLGISRTWAQHHSNCALLQTFGKCDCGLSEFRPKLEAALAALEKGEKV
jgi:hypothetical protein